MLKRQHIEYELGKLKTKIYNIEQEIFKTFTEIQEDINDLNKFVRSTYGLETKCKELSHNLYSEFKDIKNTPVFVDLTQATATTLEAIKKAKKEQDKIAKKLKREKKEKK